MLSVEISNQVLSRFPTSGVAVVNAVDEYLGGIVLLE